MMKRKPSLNIGCLLKIKDHCKENRTIKVNGEYALLVPGDGKYITYDALFPTGQRVIFIEMNWDIISDV